MKAFSLITYYLKNITFIGFLISGIILYTDFIKSNFGIICFVLFMIYSLISFILFFVKNKHESEHSINNLVVIFLHCYLMIVAFRYLNGMNTVISNNSFFDINYIMISVAILTLAINKILVCFIK